MTFDVVSLTGQALDKTLHHNKSYTPNVSKGRSFREIISILILDARRKNSFI